MCKWGSHETACFPGVWCVYAFYGRFNAPGFAPTLSPQENFTTTLPPVAIALAPALLTAIVPNYDGTKTLILIDARQDTGTNHDGGANCSDVSCTVSFVENASSGKIPLENSYISIAAAYLRN